jgi:hypothetical protein
VVTKKLQGLEQILRGNCFAALSFALSGHVKSHCDDEIRGDLLNALFGWKLSLRKRQDFAIKCSPSFETLTLVPGNT